MTTRASGRRYPVWSLLMPVGFLVPALAFAQTTLPSGNIPPAPVGHRQPSARDVPSDDSIRAAPGPDDLKIPRETSNEAFGPALKALPKLDIKGTCRRAQPLTGQQSAYQGCINDETDAQRELSRTWFDFKPGPRSTCTQETHIGGAPSYVELLTCLQLDKQAVEAQIENKKQLNVPQAPTEPQE
ncbi:MAG: hypothetical protein JO137_10815 [Hyphomicrobiales bacterium]|nr:hypothetical protein [Hyphomicrobiales bacterium]MBV9432301.1 hypothetical protein [Hyphomicrobiales bacterium]MBV9741421.1 hypothetical protein [Hyphomicrobiales bacterium]